MPPIPATPQAAAAIALRRMVAPAPYNDRFARVLGSSLTPQQVTSALSFAEIGYLWQQADLLDEIRERDGHLQSELQKRELRVAGSTWELRPPAGSGDLGAEVARFCTARLAEIEAQGDLDRSFQDALCDLMGAVYQGRSGLEVEWRQEGPYFLPARLSFVHPRRFAYTTDWRLHLWDSSGTATTSDAPRNENGPFGQFPGIPLDVFPAGKWIVHRPRVRGVYPTREGLGRLCVWWSTFKRFDVRDLLAYAEWAGRGLRIGTYATGKEGPDENPASPEDQQVLLEYLDAMSSTVAAAIPDTTKIEVVDAPNNNDVHDRVASLCNAEMSKAILGGTLGSDAGTKGARSLGEVHERNELMIARADAASLAATLRRDLLRPMVAFNFGPSAPVPSFAFAVDPAADLDRLSERLNRFVSDGGKVSQRTARNLLQIPDPEPGDELLGAPQPKPATPLAQPPST